MIGKEGELLSAQFSLLNYFGKNKGQPFAGIGLLQTIGIGTHLPLIAGYNYHLSKNICLYFQVDPVIWYSDRVFDGYNTDERYNYWLWADDGYTNFLIKTGISFKF